MVSLTVISVLMGLYLAENNVTRKPRPIKGTYWKRKCIGTIWSSVIPGPFIWITLGSFTASLHWNKSTLKWNIQSCLISYTIFWFYILNVFQEKYRRPSTGYKSTFYKYILKQNAYIFSFFWLLNIIFKCSSNYMRLHGDVLTNWSLIKKQALSHWIW